ncbi:MAG: APC family permease [Candidatus Kapaibacteriota bacterium]
MNSPSTSSGLIRSLGLKEATALNMIDMVGIGPFIVLPIVIQSMHGPHAIIAWLAGAVLALVDGCIWAELGAAMPQAGGSFVFLRESYGKSSWGLLMSFLFIWQTVFQAPLVIASGAIGFSQYASYLIPVTPFAQKAIAGSVVILIFVLLYRNIKDIGNISMFMWIAVVGTMLWLIISGGLYFNPDLAFGGISEGPSFMSSLFFVGLGHAMLKTVYSYLGYYNVCHLGGEIKNPQTVIPKSIFISIIGIAILYCAMHLSIVGVIPWQEAQKSTFIVSTFIETLHGAIAAKIATGLILFIAFASLFSVTLGYSRIPYAAAKEGSFFSIFSAVHPKEHFPHISLMILCGIAFIFSLLFRMSEIISAIVAMRALVQFIGGAIGLILLKKRKGTGFFPWKMPFYPIPIILSIVIWLGLFLSTGYFALLGIGFILIGVVLFLFMARKQSTFPFSKAQYHEA